MKTPERVAEATRLRGQGMTWREIGEHFGVSLKTAHVWVTDPDGSRQRARKDSYAQPCVDCGTPTSGSEGRRMEPRCVLCAAALAADERRIWTRDAIVLAIQEWAYEYGEPPACPDWNAWQARHQMHDEARAARAEADQVAGRYPCVQTVFRVFGSWNAALVAAGFDPRARTGSKANIARRRLHRASLRLRGHREGGTMRDQGNRRETGRTLFRRCNIERAQTKHRQEIGGLWRCVSCGHAEGEDLRAPISQPETSREPG